jgi:uncharacterized protein YbaP (TraB family)
MNRSERDGATDRTYLLPILGKPVEFSRRNFLTLAGIAACGLALRPQTSQAGVAQGEPTLWSVQRGKAKVYIFGFSDAKDRSWFTPKIQSAFDESEQIWFETPKLAPNTDEAEKKRLEEEDNRLEQKLGHDDSRSLFDVLGPQLGDRTLKMATELGVRREEIEHLRPWLAYFVINSAFFHSFHFEVSEFPDQVLGERARAEKKTVASELATPVDVTRWFASQADNVEREHMEDLLDFIDDKKAGRNREDYGWISGHADTLTLDRMREKRPAMYQAYQAMRNKQWADRIAGFLSTGQTYFVVIGRNHVVGPDSLPHCLERIGLNPRQV